MVIEHPLVLHKASPQPVSTLAHAWFIRETNHKEGCIAIYHTQSRERALHIVHTGHFPEDLTHSCRRKLWQRLNVIVQTGFFQYFGMLVAHEMLMVLLHREAKIDIRPCEGQDALA